MLKFSVLTLTLLLVGHGAALAAEKPREIAEYIHADAPYGEGELCRFMMTIYDADLWSDVKPWSWDKVFALTLRYHMKFNGSDLSARSIEEMNRQSPLSETEATSYSEQLNRLFPDVKNGDEITALYLPNRETRIFHNGKFMGSMKDKLFAKRFLSIWLDEKTSEPELRQQLLSFSSDQPSRNP